MEQYNIDELWKTANSQIAAHFDNISNSTELIKSVAIQYFDKKLYNYLLDEPIKILGGFPLVYSNESYWVSNHVFLLNSLELTMGNRIENVEWLVKSLMYSYPNGMLNFSNEMIGYMKSSNEHYLKLKSKYETYLFVCVLGIVFVSIIVSAIAISNNFNFTTTVIDYLDSLNIIDLFEFRKQLKLFNRSLSYLTETRKEDKESSKLRILKAYKDDSEEIAATKNIKDKSLYLTKRIQGKSRSKMLVVKVSTISLIFIVTP
jgi:hypothetical protein